MKLEIKYCAVWNYEPRAVSLTTRLLTTFKQNIKEFVLIPSSGGCFEVSVNGELIYSKLQIGSFPEEAKLVELLQKQ